MSSENTSKRCSACAKHRHSLQVMSSKSSKDMRTHPSSHTNYTTLTTPEKDERLHGLHSEVKKARLRESRIRKKIELALAQESVAVDETFDNDLRAVISETDDHVLPKN